MGIEKRSFEIIGSELGEHNFTEEELLIVKRVIHTTADFEYKNLLEISEGAIDKAKEVFKNGGKLYTDTNMILSGINKRALKALNSDAICYVNLDEVHTLAKERGITPSLQAFSTPAIERVIPLSFARVCTSSKLT